MLARTRRPNQIVAPQTQPFFSRNGQGGFFAPMARAVGQPASGIQTDRAGEKPNKKKQPEIHSIIQRQQTLNDVGQTDPSDKHDLTSATLTGDPILEQCFDGNLVVKTPHKGDFVTKLQKALISLGFMPEGHDDSKYGDETTQSVKDFQKAAGMSFIEWDGRVGKKTIGLLDRSLRNGQVEPDMDKASDDFKTENKQQAAKDEACKDQPTRTPCPKPNTGINKAIDGAIALIDRVLNEQLPPRQKDKTAFDYPSLFDQIFRFHDPGTQDDKADQVRTIYETIKSHLGKLKTDESLVECGTCCDGGCRVTLAYHKSLGEDKKTKDVIVFCPSLVTGTECNTHVDDDPRLIILHEAHHAAITGSSDKAYNTTRLFTRLDHKEALLNASSFHAYAAWVDDPKNQRIEQRVGQAINDTNLIRNAAEKDKVDQALAHLEMWFKLVPFDLSNTIVGVTKANQKGHYEGDGNQFRMDIVSQWFDLTRPPRRPTQIDIQNLRAIEERVNKMADVFGSPFVILPSNGNSFWEQGPGTGIAVNKALTQLDINHMIIALLQELVHATPRISADREALYVGVINDLRNLRNLAP